LLWLLVLLVVRVLQGSVLAEVAAWLAALVLCCSAGLLVWVQLSLLHAVHLRGEAALEGLDDVLLQRFQ
jgi:hypothetical protein